MVKLHYSYVGWLEEIPEFEPVLRQDSVLEAIYFLDTDGNGKDLLVGSIGQSKPLKSIVLSQEDFICKVFFRIRSRDSAEWTSFFGLGEECLVTENDEIVGFQYFILRDSPDYEQCVRIADEKLMKLNTEQVLENGTTETSEAIKPENAEPESVKSDASVCLASEAEEHSVLDNGNTLDNNAPLVSVLVPSYNHAHYIAHTIKSIISQTYRNIELLILDDGSSDDTAIVVNELRRECETRFVRFYFRMKANEGVCLTLNRLISEARGEYIFLIASDDMAKPALIETEINFLQAPANAAYSLAVCENVIIDQDGTECYWDKNRTCVYNKSEAEFLTFGQYIQKSKGIDFNSLNFGRYELLYRGNHVPNGYLIKRSFLEMTGLYIPEAPLEDYYMMLQLSKYSLFKYIDEPLFCYRWHDTNTIKNYKKISKMTLITRNIENDIISKMNISDERLLRNVLLFKYKYDLDFSRSNKQQIIAANYSLNEFCLDRYDLIQTYFDANVTPKNFGYNAFRFRDLKLNRCSSYVILLNNLKISSGQHSFDFGVYDVDTDDLLYVLNIPVNPEKNYKIFVSFGNFSCNLNFCIYAGVHAKTHNVAASINEISLYTKLFNQ